MKIRKFCTPWLFRSFLWIVILIGGARPAEAVEPHITTGFGFSVYLAADGTIWTWGENGSYQLGLGDTIQRTTPTQVPGISDVIAVSAGFYHVLALKADGTVWMWGRNVEGEQGNGAVGGTVTSPTQVASLARIIAIASGGYHCLALQQGGTVFGWGGNVYGQTGINSASSSEHTPTSITGSYRAIACGGWHSLAIGTNGAAYAWGQDSSGQLGDDALKVSKYAPTLVSGGYTDVISIAAGRDHSLMSRANMLTYAWGSDAYGQVGNGSGTSTDVTTPVSIGISSRRVMAGLFHSMAYYPAGYVYVWGDNSYGQCRVNPDTASKYDSPLGLGYLYPRFNEVSMGLSRHTPFIQSNGRLQFWGANGNSELGLGYTSTNEYSAITCPAQWSLDVIIDVAAGNAHSLALKADGTVWSWGSDSSGQLGNDVTLTNKSTPVKVSSVSGAIAIAAGGYHSLALTTTGQVYAWGQDDYGQLGDDVALANQPTPVQVSGLSSIVAIAAGGYSSYAISGFQGGGAYRAWGADFLGQLGDGGSNTNQPTPVSVATGWPVTQIDGGYGHTVFLSIVGNAYASGYNGLGGLGDGTNTASGIPVAISYAANPDGVEHVAAGQYHSIGSRYTGSCMIWGSDGAGQLGNGDPLTNSNTPGFTTSPYETKAVSAGADFADWSMLLTSRGDVYVAGSDVLGQLGDDASLINKSSLTKVGAIDRIVAIAAGDYHGLALRCDGRVFSWGNDGSGQLGDDGAFSNKATPVTVDPGWLPTVTLTITDANANEAGLGIGQFQLVRTEANPGRVRVAISTSGSAISGADYTAIASLVEIPGDSASVLTNVVPIDDPDDEDDEDIRVSINSSPSLYKVGSPSLGSIIIKDDDTAKILLGTISANTLEADNNTIAKTFTVTLASRPSAGVTLTFYSSNTLEGRVDTNIAAGNQNATSVAFTSGIGSNWNVPQTIQVFGQQDSFDDGDKFYQVQVASITTSDTKYAAVVLPAVGITNIDDDTAGFSVDGTFSNVTEAGGTGTFNVRLASQPYYPVTLNLDTDDHSEGLIQSGQESIVLDSGNWLAGVTVTVVGQDDDIDDGNVEFKVTIAPSLSSDSAYNNKGGWGILGTCIDNDTKEVRVVSTAPYNVAEGGGSVPVQYRLMTKPIGATEVRIDFSGGSQVIVDADPGTLGDQPSLVIQAASWNTPRTILVRAIDDALIEGAHSGTVSGTVTNVSGDYWNDPLDAGPNPDVDVPDVTITIADNDTPGFVLTPTTDTINRQVTSEGGDTAVFKVRLATQPGVGNSVSLVLVTTDPTEGRLDQAPMTFAATGIVGATDRINFAGGTDLSALVPNSSVMVTTGSNNINKIGRVITRDDDGDYIIVQRFTLADQLINDGAVTIVAAPPQVLTFTDSTWNVDQSVTVTGLDDAVADTNQNYTIFGGVDTTVPGHDANYTGITLVQYLNNVDDDIPGLRIIQSGGVTAVGEGGSGPGATDTFTVQLNTLPTTTVTVSIITDGQVASSLNTITFTTTSGQGAVNGVSGFDVPQTITLTAVDDLVDEDSPHASTVSFAVTAPGEISAPSYDGISVADLTLEVTDNDTASINVAPTSGVITSEGGFASNISVSLGSQPTANVDVYAVSLDPTEGSLGGTSFPVASTTSVVAGSFHQFNVSDVTDISAVTYGSYFTIGGSGPNAGKTGVALVVDNLAPDKSIIAANAVAGDSFVASGVAETITVWASQKKTFTAANWYLPQNFTVTGQNDDVDDGDQVYFLYLPGLISGDPKYAAIDPPEVLVINSDDDTRGVVVDTLGGIAVTEGGATDAYTVVLSTRPTAMVTMTIATDGQTSIDTPILTFDPSVNAPAANAWNLVRTITVEAVDDQFVEGAHTGTITHATSGGGYGGLAIVDVTAAVTDDVADVAEVLFTGGPAYTVNESGSSVQIDVTLRSRPFGNVTLVLSSSDSTEGAVSPSTLTFAPGTYNIAQTITVTGLDDAIADGDVAFAVQTLSFSGDGAYNGLVVPDLVVTTLDNDTAGIEITPASGTLNVAEEGAINSFAVRLRSQPTSSVTVAIASSNVNEGVPLNSSLTFDASNWATNQFVQVRGIDDDIHDGDQAFTVGAADIDVTSSDATYDGNFGFTVDFSNVDDDVVGVAASSPFVTTTENGVTVSFQLVLLSKPDADVTIPLSVSNIAEASLSVASVTFIPSEWDTPQTVLVTPLDDSLVDGDVSYDIILDAIVAIGETTGYAVGLDPADIPAVNKDDDTAGFSVSVEVLNTDEGGAAATFDVVLASQPSADVTIAITGLNTSEGGLSSPGFIGPATDLTFTNANWDTIQTVTVTGVDDFVDDGDQVYVLGLNATSIGDPSFNGLAVQNVSVTNADNDTAGVVIVQSGGDTMVDEAGGSDTYTINITSKPAGVVTITVSPDSQVRVNGLGTATVLTFDPDVSGGVSPAWDTVHTLTVSAIQDTFDETDPHGATITHGVAGYGVVTAQPVSVTVIDNNPPTMVANTGVTVTRAGNQIIDSAMLSYTDVETPQASLVFNLILQPGQGSLYLDYGLGSQVLMVNSSTFTMGDVQANRLTYVHAGTANNADGFAFRVQDAIGNQSDLAIFDISILGYNPPAITFSGVTPSFTEGGAAVTVDPGISVSDPDSTYYNLLRVSLVIPEVDDELYLINGGLITLSGNTVNYSATPIGTWSGGTGGNPLVVSFAAGLVGDAQAAELMSVVQYRNLSEDPVVGTRGVRFVLRDETDTENSSVSAIKPLDVFGVNDPPTISSATFITPKNVAIDGTLVVGDVDSYPLTLTVTTPPGKGTLSGALDIGTPTTLADALASRLITYTPIAGQEGTDSFVVQVTDPEGAPTSATFTVLIVGGAAAKPWVVSDPPVEAEAGSPLSYDIVVDFGELIVAPISTDVTYSLVGTLPAGVTLGGFTPSGTNATLTLVIDAGATGVIEAGVVVTETANNTTAYQPITIVIVPAGSLGG